MHKNLEEKLRFYNKVLLVDNAELLEGSNWLHLFDFSFYKIIVLASKFNLPYAGHTAFRQIPEYEFQKLLELYFTYEFSNKFFYISGNDINYASLHHMVDAGLLSAEEFWAALLIKG